MKDIVHQLTGMDMLKSAVIREGDELENAGANNNVFFEENDLTPWRPPGRFNQKTWSFILHTIRCF